MGTNIGEQFDLESLRYGKIIIMTDADVDGSHIRTLLLTLFYRHFPQLITEGHLYVAQPPLYQIKQGKKSTYVYTEEELQINLKRIEKEKPKVEPKKTKEEIEEEEKAQSEGGEDSSEDIPEGIQRIKGVSIQRYKGLGEMNPDQLWETTMNPENRVLKKVNVEDAEAADEVFDVLMGSDVVPRKRFIQTHAKNVKNLDI